jgi:hypothetical protein
MDLNGTQINDKAIEFFEKQAGSGTVEQPCYVDRANPKIGRIMNAHCNCPHCESAIPNGVPYCCWCGKELFYKQNAKLTASEPKGEIEL